MRAKHPQDIARRYIRRALSRAGNWRQPPDPIANEILESLRWQVFTLGVAYRGLIKAFILGWRKGKQPK